MADTVTPEDDIIVMMKPNGSLQCNSKQGKNRIEMQRELTEQGISVSAAYCGHYPNVDTACGLPTGQLNIYEITTEQSQIDKARSLGFEDLSSDVLIDKTCPNEEVQQTVSSDVVTVASYPSEDSTTCSETKMNYTSLALVGRYIPVSSPRCATKKPTSNNGKTLFYPLYDIHKDKLDEAKTLGFKRWVDEDIYPLPEEKSPESPKTVRVIKYNDDKSCTPRYSLLLKTQTELYQKGINVSYPGCGRETVSSNDKTKPTYAKCDGAGALNTYDIAIPELPQAMKLGFMPADDLSNNTYAKKLTLTPKSYWSKKWAAVSCELDNLDALENSTNSSTNALDIFVNNNPKNAVRIRTLLANAVTKNMLHTLITEDKSGNFSVCVEANAQTTDAQFQVWTDKLRNIQHLANSNVVITPRQTSCSLK